jgi:hypothetical protein
MRDWHSTHLAVLNGWACGIIEGGSETMAISRRTYLLALTLMVGVLLVLPAGIGLLTENKRSNA